MSKKLRLRLLGGYLFNTNKSVLQKECKKGGGVEDTFGTVHDGLG